MDNWAGKNDFVDKPLNNENEIAGSSFLLQADGWYIDTAVTVGGDITIWRTIIWL